MLFPSFKPVDHNVHFENLTVQRWKGWALGRYPIVIVETLDKGGNKVHFYAEGGLSGTVHRNMGGGRKINIRGNQKQNGDTVKLTGIEFCERCIQH